MDRNLILPGVKDRYGLGRKELSRAGTGFDGGQEGASSVEMDSQYK